ncbi:MAG: hypothetical protein WB869_06710, partial [Candidatus Acidiferrales bacterium]
MSEQNQSQRRIPTANWNERLKGLRRLPPVFRMVWNCAPEVVLLSVLARLTISVIPVGLLWVTRIIIDAIVRHNTPAHAALPGDFWLLVALEFALASLAAMLGRLLSFFDTVLADKFTRHISTRIMEHASRLDLTRYEDPLFYDKMERARVQGTDRVMLVQMMGRLIQDVVGAVSLAAGIVFFSPWLLFFLVVCIVPAFLGETHFAFLGYSL